MSEDTSEAILKSSTIARPWTLPAYLEAMETNVPRIKERYAVEFEAASELGQLFDRLAEAWRPKDRHLTEHEQLRLVFLFAVKNQMYGGIFSLLRLRAVDAMSSTRFGIEATGIAHLLWRKPALHTTYFGAYPNIGRDGASSQWKPSQKYRDAFNTGELFKCLKSSLPDLGTRLAEAYGIICYRASHAGRGILHNLQTRDGGVFYHANEFDQTMLDRNWSTLVVYYFDMARVFYEMLRGEVAGELSAAWAGDMERWREVFGKPLVEKTRKRRAAEGTTEANGTKS